MNFYREFSMPNHETFSMKPVARLLDFWTSANMLGTDKPVIVDPFARNSKRGTLRNDLNPETTAESHMEAREWLATLADNSAHVVLFDPPYSPRQISEMYQKIGRKCTTEDTQSPRLYSAVKDELARILKPCGYAICCGWNTMGIGLTRGFTMVAVLMVTHGGAHNDTLVTVECKTPPNPATETLGTTLALRGVTHSRHLRS